MPSEQLQIYFMSGTGNSYRVAEWLAERWEDVHGAATIAPIEEPPAASSSSDTGTRTLNLFTPTHGFTAPWHMLRFAFRLSNHCPEETLNQ